MSPLFSQNFRPIRGFGKWLPQAFESGYHFTETDIESRFQQLHASLKNNMANVSALELDNAIYENEQIQEEIDALYHIFTREIESQKSWRS